MSEVTRRALGWGALYLGLALLPMGIALLRAPAEGRGLWVEFGAMLGLLALGVMALQAVVSGRHRWFAESLGFDNLLQFHRRMGNAALVLVLLHPLVLLTARPEWLGYLDPRAEAVRALTLWGLLAGTLLLVVSSLWRGRLGLSYERWRLLHGLLAFGVVAGGLGHALMVGHYTAGALTVLALVAAIGLALVALLESRLLRPWRLRRRPWRVVEVAPVRGDATTLALEPVGEHRLDFVPGQFIWITLGETPFRLQQHPFSLVSSAERPRRLALTAKRLGDFTATLPEVPVGTRAFVEGPYGAFLPDVDNPSGAVLIAGGIGITPMMSMLRTFADRGERLPLWLIYANPRWEEATFREELEALAERLTLTVIHVIDEPPAGWQGESGKLDRDLLARRLPPDDGRRYYFICGPDPLMNAAEGALIELGVAPTRIYSDRFDMV
ncbi:ferredoxin reductase family protein [uncultured Halomonas sp.]|uniref:ferredoxin reductase family protein n=1 Tax=uncultured Halomonas sp. TaxID=173971 RepID=UPI0026125CE3|nr:ferredoxin reductase family protein [uncultured Halomonas sp.]